MGLCGTCALECTVPEDWPESSTSDSALLWLSKCRRVTEGEVVRELTAVEEGQVGVLQRVCSLVLGLTGEVAARLPPAARGEGGAARVVHEDTLAGRATRKVKMGNVLD